MEVGFGGRFKIGRWAPVFVTVAAPEAASGPMPVRLVVETSDPVGRRALLPMQEVEIDGVGPHRLEGVFRSGRVGGGLTVAVESEGRRIASRSLRTTASGGESLAGGLEQSVELVVTVGRPAGFEQKSGGLDARSLWRNTRVVETDEASKLPTNPLAYDALDALVLAGSFDVGDRISAAILAWVEAGGHVLFAVGSDVNEFRKSPPAEWSPIRLDESTSRLRELSGLESYSGENEAIRLTTRVKAARIVGDPPLVLVNGLDGPLLARAPLGFGRVTMLGLDLNRPPLTAWRPLPAVLRRILFEDRDRSNDRSGSDVGRISHSGVTDLATQWQAAVGDFPTVEKSSTWQVMLLTLVWMLVIGPADWFFVNRVLKRPSLTWVTLPILIAVAGGLAVWWAGESNGAGVKVVRADVVDYDVSSNTVVGRSWFSVYSPEARRYRVDAASVDPVRDVHEAAAWEPGGVTLSWSGVPERTFGGMYRPGGLEINPPAYSFAPGGGRVLNLPIEKWSVGAMTARWRTNEMDVAENVVESDLEGYGTGLRGSLKHHFAGPLEDWLLAYGNRVYISAATDNDGRSSAIEPGDGWRPDDAGRVATRQLDAWLSDTRHYRDAASTDTAAEIRSRRSRYDPRNREPADVLKMISFHDAAGGRAYTGLNNHPLSAFDLTEALRLDRAVLIGRVQRKDSGVRIDEEPVEAARQLTFVRVVLPVRRVESGGLVEPDD